jgi:tetratricopeptide (TPR) repeat protein
VQLKALPLLLLAGWALPSLPSFLDPHLPAWAERWLWNPRERTTETIRAWEAEQPEEAADFADTALRIAPDDPRTRYNAGTAHLGADDVRESIGLLEKAAQDAPPDLAPAARYNLGNARLKAKDAAGAAEAYKQALRLEPSHADAKHNLEIALKEQERQSRMQSPREGNRGDRPDQQNPSNDPGSGSPADQDDQRPSDETDPGRNDQKNQQGDQGQQPPPQGRPDKPGDQGQLPQFRNVPDMSAEEAAALLQSVENLEREQRRKQAAERAQNRSSQEKDW